jgi:hypothetical protein
MITPFKQMQSSFDKDCFFADEIYIIGYSFGDEHINMSIKTAIKYNSTLKIHIVDPSYDEADGKKGYDLLVDQFITVFSEVLEKRDTGPIKLGYKSHSYFDSRIIVSAVSFKDFLKNKLVGGADKVEDKK